LFANLFATLAGGRSHCRMSVKKISKRNSREKAAVARRQGAVPCLVIAGLILLIFALIFFASLKTL
jgi:hypothetical protein